MTTAFDGLLKSDAYINGQWVTGNTRLEVTNPATGALIGTVPNLGESETQQAIDAAENAFKSWKKTTAKHRSQLLKKWFELMNQHSETLARLMTTEQGKPLAEARGEVAYAASFAEWFAEEAKRAGGEIVPSHKADAKILVHHEPVGVVGAITPWNFPLAMITRKVAPALAAGCTVVIKPSELTPFSALAMAQLAEDAGIPAGVINVVTGMPKAIGAALTGDKRVRKITFTGSTRVGKLLMEQSAHNVKRLSLELGGNAPFIVFDDADLDQAIAGALVCKFRNAGQTCVCANRMYVHISIYDDFVARLVEKVRDFTVGNGLEDGVTMGPLINEAAVEKVERHIADALERGGKVVLGGQRHSAGGTFFQPTIITGVAADAQLCCEETFGPVAGIIPFEDEADVIEKANDTPYGLASYFFTQNLARAFRVAGELQSGIVGVNEGIISTEVAPFGGVKESGLGREGASSGIDEYLEPKYVLMGGL